jgi:hypothetical protein
MIFGRAGPVWAAAAKLIAETRTVAINLRVIVHLENFRPDHNKPNAGEAQTRSNSQFATTPVYILGTPQKWLDNPRD